MKHRNSVNQLPTSEQVREEQNRIGYKKRFRTSLRNTLAALVVVAAVAILVVTLLFPLLQVSGTSMEPTLSDKDVILLVKTSDFDTGDLVGMYHSGKILLKRVIGTPGDYISIDKDGTVFVNGEALDEPYVTGKSLGECDIEFPYQVPDEAYFILGDHRSVSVDSRSSLIGCVRDEQIIGRVIFRIWPLSKLTWLG